MRVPVVDTQGVALMPCTEAKARHLFKSGRAKPKRNKLGVFYVQLTYCQEPDNQLLEDVQAVTRQGSAGKWNTSFSPVQCGKEHLYRLLREMGLVVHLKEGWQTKELREQFGLKKTKSKSRQSFDSHAVDAWVIAASVSGAMKPADTRLWYAVPAVLHRRQLHRLQASKGGRRNPYGGTRSLSLKRGTVVRHAQYGLCTVGGFDRKRQTISLHAYRTNKRLTQGAKVKDCQVLTWVAWRSWLVTEASRRILGKGTPHPKPQTRNASFLPVSEGQGYPLAEVR